MDYKIPDPEDGARGRGTIHPRTHHTYFTADSGFIGCFTAFWWSGYSSRFSIASLCPVLLLLLYLVVLFLIFFVGDVALCMANRSSCLITIHEGIINGRGEENMCFITPCYLEYKGESGYILYTTL